MRGLRLKSGTVLTCALRHDALEDSPWSLDLKPYLSKAISVHDHLPLCPNLLLGLFLQPGQRLGHLSPHHAGVSVFTGADSVMTMVFLETDSTENLRFPSPNNFSFKYLVSKNAGVSPLLFFSSYISVPYFCHSVRELYLHFCDLLSFLNLSHVQTIFLRWIFKNFSFSYSWEVPFPKVSTLYWYLDLKRIHL